MDPGGIEAGSESELRVKTEIRENPDLWEFPEKEAELDFRQIVSIAHFHPDSDGRYGGP